MGGVMRSGRVGVWGFVYRFCDLYVHGDFEDMCIIFPLQCNTTVEDSCTVLCHFTFGFECID